MKPSLLCFSFADDQSSRVDAVGAALVTAERTQVTQDAVVVPKGVFLPCQRLRTPNDFARVVDCPGTTVIAAECPQHG